MPENAFHPPKRTLMGPGPSDVSPRVLEAMSRPTVGHLDPSFVGLMDEIKELLQYVFQTKSQLTMPISAPGSAGMETCFVNLVEPGEKVIVCQNGVFGGRMKENVERCGGEAVMVMNDWGKPVDPESLEQALSENPDAKVVAFVHAETSTGARSDAKTLVGLARAHNCLAIVDSVTSLAGCELLVDEWEIDAIYSGTQKCLSCVPGISPISFSERAQHKIKNRSTKVQSWFLDMNLIMGYWGGSAKRAYHHTAPVNAMYALHESLLIVQEEGLKNSWARHKKNHLALKAGLQAMGIDFIVDEPFRLPQLNSVTIPEGADDATLRTRLLHEYHLEVGAGLGDLAGKIWRIGLMGHASNTSNVLMCIGALDEALSSMGAKINSGAAVSAVEQYLNQN